MWNQDEDDLPKISGSVPRFEVKMSIADRAPIKGNLITSTELGKTMNHYGIRLVCRVPETHGKKPNKHDKEFAMCCPRQTAHSKQAPAKVASAMSRFLVAVCTTDPRQKKKVNSMAT